MSTVPPSSSKRKVALITGLTGQDGSFLAELLLSLNYEVHGLVRPSSTFTTERVDHILFNENMHVHHADMTDAASLLRAVRSAKPDEVYNLAAQSHVHKSFSLPEYTHQTVYVGTSNLLEAIEDAGLLTTCKFYQASSSEMFGKIEEELQKETTPFHPRSPYAVAKVGAYHLVRNYRERGMFAVNGILFNHESERRGKTFVTRKVTRYVARYMAGLETKPLSMGNLNAKRDWGYAPDFVRGMHMMMQVNEPSDYVLATGITVSVREMIQLSFAEAHVLIEFRGEGVNEIAVDVSTGKTVIKVSPRLFRPTEVDILLGDASKAKRVLGWEPVVSLQDMLRRMVAADYIEALRDSSLTVRHDMSLISAKRDTNIHNLPRVLIMGAGSFINAKLKSTEPSGLEVLYSTPNMGNPESLNDVKALLAAFRPDFVFSFIDTLTLNDNYSTMSHTLHAMHIITNLVEVAQIFDVKKVIPVIPLNVNPVVINTARDMFGLMKSQTNISWDSIVVGQIIGNTVIESLSIFHNAMIESSRGKELIVDDVCGSGISTAVHVDDVAMALWASMRCENDGRIITVTGSNGTDSWGDVLNSLKPLSCTIKLCSSVKYPNNDAILLSEKSCYDILGVQCRPAMEAVKGCFQWIATHKS